MTSQSKALLVGELNPYGSDPRYALFPYPAGSAGARLCFKILGLERGWYLAAFDRVNLCDEKFRNDDAYARAQKIVEERKYRTIVALGAKVQLAFNVSAGRGDDPFRVEHLVRNKGDGGREAWTVVCLPHPSGRCRTWNEPGAVERARAALREAGVELP